MLTYGPGGARLRDLPIPLPDDLPDSQHGSRPRPDWGWMRMARSAGSTEPPGWRPAAGSSSTAAIHPRTPRIFVTPFSSATIPGPRRRLEGARPVGQGRSRLRRGYPCPPQEPGRLAVPWPGSTSSAAISTKPRRPFFRHPIIPDNFDLPVDLNAVLTLAGADPPFGARTPSARPSGNVPKPVRGGLGCLGLRDGGRRDHEPGGSGPAGRIRGPERAGDEYSKSQFSARWVPLSTAPAGLTPRCARSMRRLGLRALTPPLNTQPPWRWRIIVWGIARRPETGCRGCWTISPAPRPATIFTSSKSVCFAARPRRWSSTTRSSRPIRSCID